MRIEDKIDMYLGEGRVDMSDFKMNGFAKEALKKINPLNGADDEKFKKICNILDGYRKDFGKGSEMWNDFFDIVLDDLEDKDISPKLGGRLLDKYGDI